MIDIGHLNTSNPLLYLTFTGYHVSQQEVQGLVISGGTADGSGLLQIQIIPALIFDATEKDVNRNLNRAIIIGTDTVRVAKTHRAGGVYIGEYGKFVNPPLPNKTPYPTGTAQSKETQISVRAYYGAARLGSETKYFVHDALYGFGGASEGFGRILYPVN